MREPFELHQDQPYERPNQLWLCGLDCEAEPCTLGPLARGRCPGSSACHPVREGDRWRCNRSTLRGGPCDEGPSPSGECCQKYVCTPVRSLRARRGRFVCASFLSALGLLCITMSSNWRNQVLLPGDLTSHHAPILERSTQTEKCANCHAAGNQTFVEWLQHATDESLSTPSQTELCLECHAKQIPREWATAAHSIATEKLQLISATDQYGPRRVDPLQPLACATCHREHHGAEHLLSWMSDQACQACHQEQYHSFVDGHPEFKKWPTARRTRIAFDHVAHEAKHFPKEKQTYACNACHQQAIDGDFQRTLDYSSACSQCHDRDMHASWEKGIPVFSLPMLEIAALEDAGFDIGQWPEEASDEFDGALPPITKFLLMAEPETLIALETLGSDFDFFDVDPDDEEQLRAASIVVVATKRLLYQIIQNGQSEIGTRVNVVLGRNVLPHELTALAAHLPPETMAVVLEQWLTNLPAEFSNEEDQLTQKEPTLSENEPTREYSQKLVSSGGWFRDDLSLAIRYQPSGHDDPWLATWIDVIAEATGRPQGKTVEPLLKQLMKPTAVGQCGSCHSLDRQPDGRLLVHWYAKQAAHPTAEFTKFSHRPHLLQTELADCKYCHQANSEAKVMESYTEFSPQNFVQGFRAITKSQCTDCHHSQSAGQSCSQCHNYHVHGTSTERGTDVSAISGP